MLFTLVSDDARRGSGQTRAVRCCVTRLCSLHCIAARSVLCVQTVAILGVVKGMDNGRHGLIFVSIMLLPLLCTAIMQLRWSNGESIDERLGRLANVNAFMLVGMDIALMVVMLEKQRQYTQTHQRERDEREPADKRALSSPTVR